MRGCLLAEEPMLFYAILGVMDVLHESDNSIDLAKGQNGKSARALKVH